MLTAECFLLFVALSQISAQLCPSQCTCSWAPTRCPPGVPLLLDGCGCCKICARRLGEPCNQIYLCDQTKELVCDYSTSKDGGRSGTCNYNDDDSCDVDGKVYQDGETFQPSCKLQCKCEDGGVTCVPLCSEDVQLPTPTCPFPHRVTVPGKCCPQWRCDGHPSSLETGLTQTAPINCPEWSTEWGACSALCGMGISSRVTNQNPFCRLESQHRLCMVRPCGAPSAATGITACKPTLVSSHPIRWETQDCVSIRTFWPTFCGSCGRRHCVPYQTCCCSPMTSLKPLLVYKQFSDGCMPFLRVGLLMVATVNRACVMFIETDTCSLCQKLSEKMTKQENNGKSGTERCHTAANKGDWVTANNELSPENCTQELDDTSLGANWNSCRFTQNLYHTKSDKSLIVLS